MSSETLSRRGLLRGAGAGIASAAAWSAWPAGAAAGERQPRLPEKELEALSAPFSRAQDPVAHLLHRATYGVRPGELDEARRMGVEAWLERQLHPETIDDSAVERQVAELFPTLRANKPQRLFDIAEEREDGGYSTAMELKRATVYRALFSKRQLYERMVELWSDHFSVYHFKDDVSMLKTFDDRDVIRPNALGRFRDLLLGSARSPAMLIYLDNASNVADGPNENYARELMELHTIGVDGGYTQQDVREVARCFTGWTVDYNYEGSNGELRFYEDLHDTGPKTVLGTPIAGGQGMLDGRRVVEILARHPSCARFISAKLCRRFVSDLPPASLVDKVAATFTSTKGDIRAVLRTLFLSDEFFASTEQKLKRPYDFLISALRALGAQVTPPDGLDHLIWSLYPLGHVPFEWEPPNGYPDAGPAWANTNGLLNRWNLASALVLNWYETVQIPVRAIVSRSRAKTPGAFVDAMASLLLQRSLDAPDRDRLIAYVAPGQPADARVPGWLLNRQAPGLLALILGSPYFQWR